MIAVHVAVEAERLAVDADARAAQARRVEAAV